VRANGRDVELSHKFVPGVGIVANTTQTMDPAAAKAPGALN
jgi:hypothetical protein